jgi:hypothetical protein
MTIVADVHVKAADSGLEDRLAEVPRPEIDFLLPLGKGEEAKDHMP